MWTAGDSLLAQANTLAAHFEYISSSAHYAKTLIDYKKICGMRTDSRYPTTRGTPQL